MRTTVSTGNRAFSVLQLLNLPVESVVQNRSASVRSAPSNTAWSVSAPTRLALVEHSLPQFGEPEIGKLHGTIGSFHAFEIGLKE